MLGNVHIALFFHDLFLMHQVTRSHHPASVRKIERKQPFVFSSDIDQVCFRKHPLLRQFGAYMRTHSHVEARKHASERASRQASKQARKKFLLVNAGWVYEQLYS